MFEILSSFKPCSPLLPRPPRQDPYPEEDWEPWQYYSAYCEDQFSIPDLTSIIQPRAGPSGKAQVLGEDRSALETCPASRVVCQGPVYLGVLRHLAPHWGQRCIRHVGRSTR